MIGANWKAKKEYFIINISPPKVFKQSLSNLHSLFLTYFWKIQCRKIFNFEKKSPVFEFKS